MIRNSYLTNNRQSHQMSQEKQLLQIIGFFGGGGSDAPEVYFLPLRKYHRSLWIY